MNLLVASLWQGAAIAVITTLAVRAVPPAAASKRHLIWWAALALTLLLPFFDIFGSAAAGHLEPSAQAIDAAGLTLPMPPAWLIFMAVGLWTGIVVAHVCRLALGVRALRRLVASSSPFDAEHVARLTRWQAARRSGRAAELRVSSEIAGACAVGFGRPIIVVSTQLASAMNDEALEAIVHEYAHLQRYDEWGRVIQCLVLAFARWHPAVLWISRQIDVEREIACDQRVVARACAPLAYARNLAEVAEFIATARGSAPQLAPGSSTATPMLRLRVERLLRFAPIRNRSFAMYASASVLAMVVAAALWLSQLPLLVTFEARVAQVAAPATLASVSFLTDLTHGLPAALGNRRGDVAASSETTVAPAQEARVALPDEPPHVRTDPITVSDSPTIQDVVRAEVTVPLLPAVHLGSTTIPFIAGVPQIEATATAEPEGFDWAALGRPSAAIGIAVARASTATGLAASRAGTSVSRFFRNGGVAFARSF
jgi:beta-lactamase regulating signal transducer with metallopeptidase domain